MAEKKVLVVHDDAAFLDRVKAGFAGIQPPFEVNGALSGPRAIGLAASQAPDVIVVDAALVGMDGYQLTQHLKADERLAPIPVIIVATQPNEATAMKARQAGAAAHLSSMADISVLVEKVLALASAEAATVPAAAAAAAATVPAAGADAGYGVPQAPPPGYGAPQPASAPSGNGGGGNGYGTVTPVAPAVEIPHIDELLRLMLDRGGSDLHITVGSAPGIRLRGEIVPVEDSMPLTQKQSQEMILSLLSEEQRRRFETELELDFAYSIPGVSRFRANVFQQRNSMGAVFRVIPIKIPTMEDLALPKVCRFLADRPRGLVLVTGPTGSGKSTTLAAMVNHINDTRACHIITLEDPIEFMHKNKKAYVNQREIGEDTHSFSAALKRVLRQDPDVILVGELRDLETISAAITAAETGHLVLATLHTTGGPATVDRVIDVFPPHQQQQVRMQLSTTLEGVLSQVLLRSTDGRSRVMAMEIMLGVPAISNLIREGKTHQMATIIQGGQSQGMQTLDQHLKTLLQGGKITFEEAVSKAMNPKELAQMMGRKI